MMIMINDDIYFIQNNSLTKKFFLKCQADTSNKSNKFTFSLYVTSTKQIFLH